jgi:hypothetical protein
MRVWRRSCVQSSKSFKNKRADVCSGRIPGMNPASSFVRFALGFLTFISVSFLVTFAVHSYTLAQDASAQAAAALQAMVSEK